MQRGEDRCSPTGRDELFRGIGTGKEIVHGHGLDCYGYPCLRIGSSKRTHAEEMQLGQDTCITGRGRDAGTTCNKSKICTKRDRWVMIDDTSWKSLSRTKVQPLFMYLWSHNHDEVLISWGITVMIRYYNHEGFQSRWGPPIMMWFYNHDVFLQLWGLKIMMRFHSHDERSYNRDEILRPWWGVRIMMRSHSHDEVLQSWWGLTMMMGSYNLDKVLQSWWGLSSMMRS